MRTAKSRLQLYREMRGLSRADLAEKVGISRQQILNLETKNAHPSLGVAQRIAKHLHVSADNLWPLG